MSFFYIVHVVVCILLILIILFQDGKTGGLVSVADTGNSVFGASGASSFLTKLTSGVAIVFMVTSVFLAFLNSPGDKSIADDYTPPPAQTSNSTAAPNAQTDAAPTNGDVVVTDENGNQTAKPLSSTDMTIEKFSQDQVPKEILESERLLKEKEAAQKAKEAGDKAKSDNKKTDKPKTEKQKEDQ